MPGTRAHPLGSDGAGFIFRVKNCLEDDVSPKGSCAGAMVNAATFGKRDLPEGG